MQPTPSTSTRPWKSTYVTAMKAYATFHGRASRKEFWGFTTAYLVLGFITGVVDEAWEGAADGLGTLTTIVLLVHVLPFIAVTVRRMHDLERTGWWALLHLTLVGAIVLLFLANGTGNPRRQPLRAGTRRWGWAGAQCRRWNAVFS